MALLLSSDRIRSSTSSSENSKLVGQSAESMVIRSSTLRGGSWVLKLFSNTSPSRVALSTGDVASIPLLISVGILESF